MTPLFPAQRAAEEFDQVLEGTATTAVAERYAELFDDRRARCARSPRCCPAPSSSSDLRSRLMTAAETELVPRRARRTPTRAQAAPTRATAASAPSPPRLVIVGGTAGMAAAASGRAARATRSTRSSAASSRSATRRTSSDAGQGDALLDQAATRLDEVRALQAQGSADPDLIAATLDAFRSAADAGSDKLFTGYQADGDAGRHHHRPRLHRDPDGRRRRPVRRADTGDRRPARSTPPTRWPTSTSRPACLCGACGPARRSRRPAALSSGAGAATVANLIARPVTQAQRRRRRGPCARRRPGSPARRGGGRAQLPRPPRRSSATTPGRGRRLRQAPATR